MSMLESREQWHHIERVLTDRVGEKAPRDAETMRQLDPMTMAQNLVELAKQYDDDARQARQAAASCRQYARDLRAGRAACDSAASG